MIRVRWKRAHVCLLVRTESRWEWGGAGCGGLPTPCLALRSTPSALSLEGLLFSSGEGVDGLDVVLSEQPVCRSGVTAPLPEPQRTTTGTEAGRRRCGEAQTQRLLSEGWACVLLCGEAARPAGGGGRTVGRRVSPWAVVSVPLTVGLTASGPQASGPLAPDAACRGQAGGMSSGKSLLGPGETAGLHV